MRRSDRDTGFTLIELLITIVILGTLATVVVTSVSGISDRGDDSVCSIDARTLATAVEAYFGEYETISIPSGGGDDGHEMTLRSAGFIRDVSVNWDVAADGSLSPAAGSNCV